MAAEAGAQDLVHWWTMFNDPALTSLVDRAVKSNLDLKQAEARIRQARAARGVAAAGLWPAVSASGSYTRSRTPVDTPKGTKGVISDLYRDGLDASWEIDIFGGIRRGVEAADADIQAAVEDRRDVLVTLVAEVALNYIDLRAFQQRIAIAQENLKAQKDSAELTRKRKMAGFVGSLDVANAEALVATTASTIPQLEASAQQTIYSLSVLLGEPPGALLAELSPSSDIPAAPPAPPAGVPSELLRRRPDIRRAEAQIHSATARIGVATADLFPKFTLSGSAGFTGSHSNDLLDWAHRFWSVGPSASWQLFSGGSTVSTIEAQKALQEQSLLTYRQTVLTALQDVENALIASAREAEHRKALIDAVAANRKAVDYATQLYVNGQTDFLSVLDAQRSLFATEDALVQSTGVVSTDLVALYKALGGGWDDGPEMPRESVAPSQ
jgi:NodT family efflux transporter outer membrane factor (OMF) lipoprotein